MLDERAFRVALDLLHVPSQLHLTRAQPLPGAVSDLLRVAAGDDDALGKAAHAMRRPTEIIQKAAIFYIEQVLFAPNADSYRILGACPDAPREELRRNMGLLIKFLHPDVNENADRSLSVARVTGAWDSLKTSERRAAYDANLRKTKRGKPRTSRRALPRSGHSQARKRDARTHDGRARLGQSRGTYKAKRVGLLRRLLWRVLSGVRR